MKKTFMKIIRDNLPEPVKFMVGPLFRNKLVFNDEFCRYYDLLVERQYMNADEIKAYQLKQLKEILIHSYKTVPYYRELFNNISFNPDRFSDFQEMEKIPFLTRELIIKNFAKLISTEKVKNGYYTGLTGGSTGLALQILLDYDSIYKENAFIYFYRQELGYDFTDKVVSFRNHGSLKKIWKRSPMYNDVIFSNVQLSKVTIHKYAKKFNEIKPHFINGYISGIWYFAKLMKENNLSLDFKPKGIFMISENADPEQREFIEQFFGVRSLTFYGHSERCVIAQEIFPDKYVFDPFYGYTELIPTGNNEFTITGTGFLNRKMPLIRYRTDDICNPDGEYYRIHGKRISNMGLYGKNSEFLNATGFYIHTQTFRNIINYQFIQKEIGKADLLIIVNKEFSMEEMPTIKKEVSKVTKGIIDLDIKIVDRMILTERGKFQKYITYVNRN